MTRTTSFRIGKVTIYLRARVWYLRYHEHGRRRQVRGGPDREAVRQLAAQVNAQLELGVPAATSFEAVSVPELRRRWLEHHEHVRRSSVATLNRYRTASEHLLRFVAKVQPVRCASHFRPSHAEAFVRYLRTITVAPNGHAKAAKRKLRDKGVKYVLEVCRTLFQFAAKRRHLPPYADNPFTTIEIDRIPVEDSRPFVDLDAEQQRALLEACDTWQLPIFATLLLTGLRVGELTHLFVEDVDLEHCWLHVRNKPELGWQIKTRGERQVPLLSVLATTLRQVIGERITGPVFLRRRFTDAPPSLAEWDRPELAERLRQRMATDEARIARPLSRVEQQKSARHLWRDMGVSPSPSSETVHSFTSRAAGKVEHAMVAVVAMLAQEQRLGHELHAFRFPASLGIVGHAAALGVDRHRLLAIGTDQVELGGQAKRRN
ncbi:MAG: tyrosine-type recombinase/integrase [Phycisphaeraceae bacterium]